MTSPAPARTYAALAGRGAHSVRRSTAPAVLLASMAVAFGGLTLTESSTPADTTSVTALTAAASRPISAPGTAPVDVIYGLGEVPEPTASPARPAARRAGQPARASRSRTARWVSPVGGHLTSRFGWRWGRAHKGVDIGATYGAPVRAAGAGTVVSAGWSGGYGKLVTVRHADGTITAYAHMSAITVYSGRVAAGEQIGRVGSTGNSTGPHLHFEVRTSRGTLNPLKWLSTRGIGF